MDKWLRACTVHDGPVRLSATRTVLHILSRCKDCVAAGNEGKIFVGVDRGKWYEKKLQETLSTRPSTAHRDPLCSRTSQDAVQIPQSGLQWQRFPSIVIPPFFCYGVIHSHIIGSISVTQQLENNSENLADFSTLKPMRKGRQYFTSGHVSSIMDSADHLHYFLKCKVRASYKDLAYDVSVALGLKDAKVVTGTCQCKGSAMGRCSHIAALLFALEDYTIHFGYQPPSCTSMICQWNVGRQKRKNPGAARESAYNKKLPTDRIINFHPRSQRLVDTESENKACERFIATLPATGNFSMFLQVLEPRYEDYIVTPERLSVLHKLRDTFIQSMSIEAGSLPHQLPGTEKQADAEAWHLARLHRLTASQCKEFVSVKSDSTMYNLIRNKLYEVRNITTKEMKYGTTNEACAYKLYREFMTVKGYEVKKSGFWVNPTYPEMGCSPDGLVYIQGNINGIIEIKCPYVLSSCPPLSIDVGLTKQQHNQFCSSKVNGKLVLKKSHKYYYQIQMQMAICEVKWCDFIIWSPKGMYVERITYDEEFWMPLALALRKISHSLLIPEIIEMRVARKLPLLKM